MDYRISKLKPVLFVMLLFLLSFTYVNNNNKVTEWELYNKLHFLKAAQAPKEMNIINVNNSSYNNKPVAQKGILITYKNLAAKNVSIAGDFSNWEKIKMDRSKYGVWFYFFTINELKSKYKTNNIRYKFSVDDFWTEDPENFNKSDDNKGSYFSLLFFNPDSIPEGEHLTYKIIEQNIVEFRLYRPEAKCISIVGDFNNWNPENDFLEKGSKGIWRLQKRLLKGTYRYNYIIDGKWEVDYYNQHSASDGKDGLSSMIIIE